MQRTTLGDIMSERRFPKIDRTATGNSVSTIPQIPPPTSTTTSNKNVISSPSSSSSSLASLYGITHPLNRMALTANGHLQRLVSSYYDAPVSIVVLSCTMRPSTTTITMIETNDHVTIVSNVSSILPIHHSTSQQQQQQRQQKEQPQQQQHNQTWDRVVQLMVHDQVFCTAQSVITVRDPHCQQLVQSGDIGLGQLFRYLDILPMFTLHAAAPSRSSFASSSTVNNTNNGMQQQCFSSLAAHREDCHAIHDACCTDDNEDNEGGGGGFWRDYSLDCEELSCRIREDFVVGMWNLQPQEYPSSCEDT
jgi:hypothetical protein